MIRNISDTALWAAMYRARENDRRDALFRDPFARRLAGPRGEQIAETLGGSREAWAWVTRTYLFDQFITEQVGQGTDMVVNLAAGLDARPYRMPLPPSLTWIEIDLPELLTDKERALAGEKPACSLERIALDLSNERARRELFERLGARAGRALVITEGLLIYLTRDEAASLATDLAASHGFQRWAFDLVSPGLLRMLQKQMGEKLSLAGAPLQFGPPEGPGFFAPHGWRAIDVRSIAKTAARLKRTPAWMRLVAMLPESRGPQGSRPWGGVCLATKA